MDRLEEIQAEANDPLQVPLDPKPRANSDCMAKPPRGTEKQPQLGMPLDKPSSEPAIPSSRTQYGHDDSAPKKRNRSGSEPVAYDRSKAYFFHRSESLTEQAKHLSEEEIQALEIDIFKPLDFYEILFERIKANDSGMVITSLSELDNLCT